MLMNFSDYSNYCRYDVDLTDFFAFEYRDHKVESVGATDTDDRQK